MADRRFSDTHVITSVTSEEFFQAQLSRARRRQELSEVSRDLDFIQIVPGKV